MKKQYENPTISLTYVDNANILNTSGEWDGNNAIYTSDDTAQDIWG